LTVFKDINFSFYKTSVENHFAS